uniref:KRAB-related domain-containing protein n=1 Tax=Pipistrellus kuhlii TaxID=59472 RepID=A0A7J7T273_PIPKU|nr:hypothetical protein mPipKuh1_016718 [Pipistrellus kuhlii]
MSRDSSWDNNPMEDSQDSQETREQLEEVRKCFTEEEWTKLDNADKLTYVYMKKRYDFMTALGLMAVGPHSLLPNKGIPKSPDQGLDETQNPGHHDFPGTSGASQDLGDLYQQGSSVLYDLLTNESPQEASKDQQSKDLKVEPMEEAPPVTPDSEPAPKQLCSPAKEKAKHQLRKKPESRKEETNAWLGRLRERTDHIVYGEISDPEEDD